MKTQGFITKDRAHIYVRNELTGGKILNIGDGINVTLTREESLSLAELLAMSNVALPGNPTPAPVRRGRFILTGDYYRTGFEPVKNHLERILSVIPLQNDRYMIEAICEDFKPVSEGTAIPEYTCTCVRKKPNDPSPTVEFSPVAI